MNISDIILLYITPPVLCCFAALGLTRGLIPLLKRWNIVVNGGGRHVHDAAIPTMGGIAMIIPIIAFILLNNMFSLGKISELHMHVRMILPLTVLILVGMIDDIFDIRARYKLLLQLLVGILSWLCGISINNLWGYELPTFMSLLLTVLWITSYINAFNFIDGLDGLAAGVSAVCAMCLGVAMILHDLGCCAVLMFCLVGACIGFLRYNFHPAKVFMGDTGSMFLGYMFASIAIISSTKSVSFSTITISLLACGVPLLDTFLAVWRRVTRRVLSGSGGGNVGVMKADKEHLHHRLLDHKQSQSSTVVTIYFIGLFFGICGIVASIYNDLIPGLTFILLLLAFAFVIKRLAIVEIWNSTQLIVNRYKHTGKGYIINMLHPLWDLFAVLCAAFSSVVLIETGETITSRMLLLYMVVPTVVILSFSGIYKIFWLRPGLDAFVRIIKVLLMVFIVSYVMLYSFEHVESRIAFDVSVVFGIISSLLIAVERGLLVWFKSSFIKHVYESSLNVQSIPVVLYGGGLNAFWYINRRNTGLAGREFTVIGFIDDAVELKGLQVYGYPVLGGVKELESIYARTPFKKVLITTSIKSDKAKTILMKFCQERGISITELIIKEQDYK